MKKVFLLLALLMPLMASAQSKANGFNIQMYGDSIGNNPIIGDSIGNNPIIGDSIGNNPIVNDSIGNNPIVNDSTGNNPIVNDSIGNKPIVNDSTEVRIAINATNFPDANFRSWLLQQSYGSDGILTQTEIENIERIVLMSQNIRNLKGIEFFTQIELLNCVGNLIDSLDVSKNTALTNIQCSENNLKSLDVSNNTLLETLSCNNNQLTSLYLSRNTALQSLQCNNNKLTSLNVSNNTALTYLDCYSNQINGAAMDSLVGGLPVITSGSMWDGQMYVIYNQNEGNDMTVAQVSAAKAKGWTPKYYVSREEGWQEYAGSGPDTLKCAQPVINYEDGKVTFSCETEDVEFHYNCYAIYRANGEGDEIEVSQQQYIRIDVYASKEGYEDSETKSAVISVGGAVGKKGDVNMDGIVNGTDIQEVINIIVNAE